MRIDKIQKENRITIGLLAVNILTFIVLSFLGDTQSSQFMYDHGAVFAPAVIENGEYYRLFTSMFLHFDFSFQKLILFIIYYKLFYCNIIGECI